MDRRSDPIFVHFYRAVISHMDVWRQRMDATTNWAAATAAGMITFTFSTMSAPHYVLLITLAFQVMFLIMESRRYQTFDLWRHRFRRLNRVMIVPALENRPLDEQTEAELLELARDMGRTVPKLSLSKAMGYRVRRNYGYLFGVTLLAWVMKLEIQPTPAGSLLVAVERATIAFLPGWLVVAGMLGFALALLVLAARAPTHDIVDWEATEASWTRWSSRARTLSMRLRGGRTDAQAARSNSTEEPDGA